MDAENQARLRAYCAMLDIRESSTEPNPALALQVLARMYLVPTIEDHGERNQALNGIRGNLGGEFGKWSPFVGETAQVHAMMKVLPHWFDHLSESTEVLIEQYKSLSTAIRVLQALGLGAGGGSAILGGLAEASKQNSVRAGVERGARRNRLRGRDVAPQRLQPRGDVHRCGHGDGDWAPWPRPSPWLEAALARACPCRQPGHAVEPVRSVLPCRVWKRRSLPRGSR